ncbi:MAG TPA: glutaminyl-peptide cyclotransferase [Pirellulaceae bacterium]|nr:glutaminyl-peptide cyclotransferase [Pirellulaceae bacterium]
MTSTSEDSLLNWRALFTNPRRFWFLLLFVAVAGGGSFLVAFRFGATDVPVYSFRVVAEYPHDPTAFTQGLWIDDQGFVYESTGKWGQSRIRKYELKSGKIVQERRLPDQYFGEGLTFFDGKFYQLTWRERKVFVYDAQFELLDELENDGDGWGLTHDDTHLIMSDGSSKLRFMDPVTFQQVRWVDVKQGAYHVKNLNELEKIGNKVYANRLHTDWIYDIDPTTGQVNAIVDLTGLWPPAQRPPEGVLNGIAYNPQTKRMIVTGKYCPKLFELELFLKKQ